MWRKNVNEKKTVQYACWSEKEIGIQLRNVWSGTILEKARTRSVNPIKITIQKKAKIKRLSLRIGEINEWSVVEENCNGIRRENDLDRNTYNELKSS